MTKPIYSDAEIDRIARDLIATRLPKPDWTHAAHWAAALWLLRSPDHVAERDMPDIIRRYNNATGTANTDTSGYHETITFASLRLARRYLDAAAAEMPLSAVLDTLLRGPARRPDWLLSHWSKPVLFSSEARRHWIAPDLRPL